VLCLPPAGSKLTTQAGALRLEGFSTRVGKVMPITLENCVLANNRPAHGALVSVLHQAVANGLLLVLLHCMVGLSVCSARDGVFQGTVPCMQSWRETVHSM
jgi:hypothetical protein